MIEQAFMYTGVEKVIFEDNSQLQTIGDYAFMSCSLGEVVFGKNSQLESIGQNAFANLGLTSINIPDSVKTIEDGVFSSSNALTEINFGENSQLESIGNYAFNIYDLTNIELPASIRSIGRGVFYINFTELIYRGTMEQWGKISLHETWNENSKIKKVICSDGEIIL